MGIAVLDRYSIFDCCVKSFPGRWSTGKKRAILAVIMEYIDVYGITQVSVKMPTLSIEAPAVAELLVDMERLAEAKKARVYRCTLVELKERFGFNKEVNKNKLMSKVLEKHPELRQEYECVLKSKVKHFEKLFEAVGAANTYFKHY